MTDSSSLIWIPNGAVPSTPVPWYTTWKAPAAWQSVSVNRSSTDVNVNADPFNWPGGAVLAHPGQAGPGAAPYTVIEWKSPVAGSVDISITLADLHGKSGQDGVRFWVYKNSTLLSGNPEVVAEGFPGPIPTTFTDQDVLVELGDSIYLVLGLGITYSYDSTQVDFSVTMPDPPLVSTPASSAWSLALLAGIGIAAVPTIRRRA